MSDDQEFIQFAQQLTQPEAKAEPVVATEAKAEEPKAEESKVEVKEEKKEEKKPFDWRAAAEKERARREAKFAARRESEALREKASKLEQIEQLKSKDPFEALKALGLTYEELTKRYIDGLEKNPGAETPEERAEADRLAKLEAKLADLEREKLEARERERASASDRAFSELTTKAADAIKAKADEFELLSRHPRGGEIVAHLQVSHFADTAVRDENGVIIEPGEELDIQVACRHIEETLLEEVKPFIEAKKLKALIAPAKTGEPTTLTGDMREGSPRKSDGDDDKEFLNRAFQIMQSAV